MSDGTCSIPGEVLLYPSIPGEVLLYPSIKPPPPGVPVNALAATQILTDLIAELRSPFFSMDPELDPVLDRAEARLREVTGDE